MDMDNPRTYGPAIDLQSLEVRKAHYAAALEVWRTLQQARTWLKPSGPPRGLTHSEAAEVELHGYPTDCLHDVQIRQKLPIPEGEKRFEGGEAECWACGVTDDEHLLFSFYCGAHCHSINHHLPTVESGKRFGERLRAIVEYARLGGTDDHSDV